MKYLTTLVFYLGMGALTHWLWLGEHLDPSNVFGWACIGAWVALLPAWVVWKFSGVALGLVLLVLGIVLFLLCWESRPLKEWRRNRMRRRAQQAKENSSQ